MDLWFAVAAGGAGYVAKHWLNLLRDRKSSQNFPSGDSDFVNPESPADQSRPHPRLGQRETLGEDTSAEREREHMAQCGTTAEEASTSGFDSEILVSSNNFENCNILSISSLSPGHFRNEDLQVVVEGLTENGNMGDNFGESFPEPSMTEIRDSYACTKNKRFLRSRQSNMHIIKPLTSLESCLMAQLYKQHAGMECHVPSFALSSSSPTATRPFFVTDGKRIISKGGAHSSKFHLETEKKKLHEQLFSADNQPVSGVPRLPHVESLVLRRTKVKTGKGLDGKLSSSSKKVNGKHFHSLVGSSHGALLFGVGLSVGLISSFLANKREMEKLNDLLKQTENLVQDLQDELEMKDSLTVNEIIIEDHEPQDSSYHSYNKLEPHSFSSEHNLDRSAKYDGKVFHDQKAGENSESLSKIEAELEAELERLELNINSSSLEGRLSALVELDPDFMPSISKDELRADRFGRVAGDKPFADQDGSGTSTPHSAHYAVSPRELSLRLHEVIQSRLEERVKELETALENSQMKVHIRETERKSFWKDSPDSELRSSSYQGSPVVIEERNAIDQPVVINLTAEALDAYNEACDVFAKMNDPEEADLISVGKENHQKALPLFDHNVHQGQNGEVNHFQLQYTTTDGKAVPTLIPHGARASDEHISSRDDAFSGDESDSSDDELEKLLIKQIVEKTKKGKVLL